MASTWILILDFTSHLTDPMRFLPVILLLALPALGRAGLLPPFPAESAPPDSSLHAPVPAETDADLATNLAAQLVKRQASRKDKVVSTIPSRTKSPARPVFSPRRIVDAPSPPVVPAYLPAVLDAPIEGDLTADAGSVAPVTTLQTSSEGEPDLSTLTTGATASEIPAPEGPSAALLPSLDEMASVSLSAAHDLPAEELLTELDSAPEPDVSVAREELVPKPTSGSSAIEGPVFRINGAEAVAYTRRLGYRFTPAGGNGPRDGVHTVASQFPRVLSSEVNETFLSQMRPPAAWTLAETSNTFFMFCDSRYNAVRLNPGWRIRGIKLNGPNWEWVACPRSGAATASFSVRIYAYKNPHAPNSVVQLTGLTLEGPEGATDWRMAFPSLREKNAQPKEAPIQPVQPAALASRATQ